MVIMMLVMMVLLLGPGHMGGDGGQGPRNEEAPPAVEAGPK